MIIAYLIYDTRSLRACTSTCYSWYIAAVPHPHHTLTIQTKRWHPMIRGWGHRLLFMHMLGLLPLVKTLRIRWYEGSGGYVWKTPELSICCILLQFFALTNVRDLDIDYLDIPNLMQRSTRYFKHFLPTVRSLALREPRGTNRQIIYFIGLFQHLQDLRLICKARGWGKPVEDLTLVPPFAPPLDGWLTMEFYIEADLLEDMINLFGGIRFRHMNLYCMPRMQLLLDACTETLESLVLSETDTHGEQFSPKGVRVLANDFAAESYLWDIDLSRHKSLRTLWVPASSISRVPAGSDTPGIADFLTHVLSTITSSAFPEIIVLYGEDDFHGVEPWSSDWPPLHELSQAERAEAASQHRERFEVLREVHKVQEFRLVLCVRVWHRMGEYLVQMLEEAVAEEKAKRGFDNLLSEPLVVYDPQRTNRWLDGYSGGRGVWIPTTR